MEHSLVLTETSSTPCCEWLSFYFSFQIDPRKEGSRTSSSPLPRSPVQLEGPTLLTKPQIPCRLSVAEGRRLIVLLSRAKPGHKLALCKQRQALNSLDNLLQIICPALLINVCEALGGLNALEPSFT